MIISMKSSRMRWARHAASKEKKRNACSFFMEKSEGKRPVGRNRSR
jgi:hypothetical protein